MGNQEGRTIKHQSVQEFDKALAETLGFGRSLEDYEDYLGPLDPFIRTMAHIFPGEKLRVLDIGAGQGVASSQLQAEAEISGHDLTVVGLSLTAMPTRLRAYCLGEVNCLPFADNTFHGLISVHCWQYLENEIGALKEALRILKPGGEFRLYIGCCPGGDCMLKVGQDIHQVRVPKKTSLLSFNAETGLPDWVTTIRRIGKNINLQPRPVPLANGKVYLDFFKPVLRGKKR